MQRQRGELVPIGEVVSGLDDVLVPAIRETSPQARHCFTVADQVNLLVGASEADPDRGFMARTMALCSLPRSNPGNRLQYKRVNGPYKLIMIAGGDNKLPFGNLPRLLLAWVCTEAVRTGNRELILGKSLSDFMRSLGVYSSDGKAYIRLRNQMKRLFGCTVTMVYEEPGGFARVCTVAACSAVGDSNYNGWINDVHDQSSPAYVWPNLYQDDWDVVCSPSDSNVPCKRVDATIRAGGVASFYSGDLCDSSCNPACGGPDDGWPWW